MTSLVQPFGQQLDLTSFVNEQGLEVWNVSPSQMSMHKNCARSWELYYVDGIGKARTTKRYFEIGNYFHELMHVYYHLIKEGHRPGSDFLEQAMNSRMKRDFEAITDSETVPILGLVSKLVRDYVAQQSPIIDKGIEVIGVENKLKVPVKTPNGNLAILHCITDLLYKTASGKLTTRDHKTGEKKNSWHPSHIPLENQLLFNSAAYFLKTGEFPLRVEISFTCSYNYVKIPPLNERYKLLSYTHTEISILNYIQEIYRFIDQTIETQHFARSYSKDCSNCQFNEVCVEELRGMDIKGLIRSRYERIERDYEVRLKFGHKRPPSIAPPKSSTGNEKPFKLSFNV